jgi:uncharacterized protein YegL
MDHYTEVVVIIDRSGSMQPFLKDTVGGYNSFVEAQKKLPGDAKLTTVIFDTEYEVLENAIDLQKARTMNERDFMPRGGTSLLDAIGKTINKVLGRLDSLMAMDRTKKVIVAIITDGQENSSREFNKQQIKTMIERQTELGWKFDFLSADMNAINDATTWGIDRSNTMLFSQTSKGFDHTYDTMHASAMSYRSGTKFSVQSAEGQE